MSCYYLPNSTKTALQNTVRPYSEVETRSCTCTYDPEVETRSCTCIYTSKVNVPIRGSFIISSLQLTGGQGTPLAKNVQLCFYSCRSFLLLLNHLNLTRESLEHSLLSYCSSLLAARPKDRTHAATHEHYEDEDVYTLMPARQLPLRAADRCVVVVGFETLNSLEGPSAALWCRALTLYLTSSPRPIATRGWEGFWFLARTRRRTRAGTMGRAPY